MDANRIWKEEPTQDTVKRATKTKENNDIDILKESKRHTFQIWSCDIKSSAQGWTKKIERPSFPWKWYIVNSFSIFPPSPIINGRSLSVV